MKSLQEMRRETHNKSNLIETFSRKNSKKQNIIKGKSVLANQNLKKPTTTFQN